MMGPDDPTVRGRRISVASMAQMQRSFEQYYREPIRFALELADRVRTEVAEAIDQNGPSKDGEYEEEVGMKAWKEIAADPSVRKAFVEFLEGTGES
jgi:hypothetical protein